MKTIMASSSSERSSSSVSSNGGRTIIKGLVVAVLHVSAISMMLFCGGGDAARALPTEAIKKTIKTEDGDIFDCVDIYKQPAFDHPLLKDHKILMKPDIALEDLQQHYHKENKSNGAFSFARPADGGCPPGTVPVHRLPQNHNTSSSSSRTLLLPPISAPTYNPKDDHPDISHMWAMKFTHPRTYYGASADINVYSVEPIQQKDLSAAVLLLHNRDSSSPDQAAVIRAGWIVLPALFGDSRTRLFIKWSADDDRSTGCFNLVCPGFVQINYDVFLGARLSPVSVYDGDQCYISVYLFRDSRRNWWFFLNELSLTNLVGYLPAELFKGRFEHASVVQYGGVVNCPRGRDCPPMGNGHHPMHWGEMWKSCSIRRAKVVEDNSEMRFEEIGYLNEISNSNNPDCYGDSIYRWIYGGNYYKFTFGGPVCAP